MTFHELTDALNGYQPQLLLRHTATHLTAAEPLDSSVDPEQDVLYLAERPEDVISCPDREINLLICSARPGASYPAQANLLLLEEADAAHVFSVVRSCFREEHRLQDFGQQLLAVLSSDGSLQRIVDEAFHHIGNPIFVFDAGFSLIAANWDLDLPDFHSERLLTDRYLNLSDMKAINFDHIHERVMKSDQPMLVQNPNYDGDRIVARLAFHQKNVGHIGVTDRLRPFTACDYKAIAILRDVLVQCLQRDEFVRNSRGFHYEYLITDLLDGKITLGKQLQDRLAYVDLHFEELIYITVAELARSAQFINPTNVRNRFEQLLPGSRSILYNGQVVLVTTRRASQPITREEAERLRACCREDGLFCGMSNSFRGVAELPNFYRQALRAMELGTRNREEPSLYIYEEHATDHIMAQFCQREDPMVFCHPAVRLLLDYDAKRNTELTETLYRYLLWERNVVLTARKMHVHRNTLAYRLNKIATLVQVDLEDAQTRQYLMASLQAVLS